MQHFSRELSTTSWTIVSQATGDSEAAQQALETLCLRYWYPVYAFIRKSGMQAADAEDATQAFFAWVLDSEVVARADPNRGKFRSFLIVALKQFLARRREFESAAKRNPDKPVLPLEIASGDKRYLQEPADIATPDRLYEHAWALSVIESAMCRLRSEWESAGKGQRFEVLKSRLIEPEGIKGIELAEKLGISEGAMRVALHRLKKRFGELLRHEVTCTVNESANVGQEIDVLLNALRAAKKR